MAGKKTKRKENMKLKEGVWKALTDGVSTWSWGLKVGFKRFKEWLKIFVEESTDLKKS